MYYDYRPQGTTPIQPVPAARITKYDKYQTARQLTKAIGDSQEILATATTVFPFTLFPDTVLLDRTKLTVTHRSFFGIAEVASIRVEDILNVTANVGPFFGSLVVTTRFFDTQQKPYEVNWLWRSDAVKMKRILQGYILATQRKIDCSALNTHELSTMLDELGRGGPD